MATISQAGGSASFHAVDVTSHQSVIALHAYVAETHARLDAVVNNAGMSSTFQAFHDTLTEDMDLMYNINQRGTFWCMQEQIKIMLKQQKLGDAGKKGTIVNMASMSGLIGVPYAAPYSSTKHAVRKLSSYHEIVPAADSSTRSSASPNQQPWSTHMKASTSPPSLLVSLTRGCRYWKRVTTVAHTQENKLLLCTP